MAGRVLWVPRSLLRVTSLSPFPSPAVFAIAHTLGLWYRRGGSAHAQPEYWFSTDAYITTADKRHLHFDGLRRVHLTFRMHFVGRAYVHTSALPREKLNLTYIYHPILHTYAYNRLYLSRVTNSLRICPHNKLAIAGESRIIWAWRTIHISLRTYTYVTENLNRKILEKLPEIKTRTSEWQN